MSILTAFSGYFIGDDDACVAYSPKIGEVVVVVVVVEVLVVFDVVVVILAVVVDGWVTTQNQSILI